MLLNGSHRCHSRGGRDRSYQRRASDEEGSYVFSYSLVSNGVEYVRNTNNRGASDGCGSVYGTRNQVFSDRAWVSNSRALSYCRAPSRDCSRGYEGNGLVRFVRDVSSVCDYGRRSCSPRGH